MVGYKSHVEIWRPQECHKTSHWDSGMSRLDSIFIHVLLGHQVELLGMSQRDLKQMSHNILVKDLNLCSVFFFLMLLPKRG